MGLDRYLESIESAPRELGKARQRIAELEAKLAEAEKDRERLLERAQAVVNEVVWLKKAIHAAREGE